MLHINKGKSEKNEILLERVGRNNRQTENYANF